MTPAIPDPAPPTGTLGSRLRNVHTLLGCVVIAIGITVLIGWATDSAPLRSVVPGMITMKVNTALGLMLLATALIGLDRHTTPWRLAVWACLSAVLLLATATLAEYAFGLDLRIDNAFVLDHDSPRYPGRSAPATVLAFLGLMTAIALLHLRRATLVAQSLLFVAAMTPLTTLGGYLYQTPGLYWNAPYPVIALNTSVGLMLLCVGGLFARADAAMMGIVTSRSLAGSVARKLLPAAVGLPLLTGLLVLAGLRAGLYTIAFGSALLVTCCVLFFAAAVSWTTTLLSRAEASRAAAERDARRVEEVATRTKDEFLSVISHELRTPLNAILGWSQILRAGADAQETATGLEVIDRNARAQVRIIEDLLDMGRIVGGKILLDAQDTDLAVIVDTAVQSARPVADEKGVTLQGPTPADPVLVRGDSGRLGQVVGNLLSNAIKFTPAGGRVRVDLDRTDGRGRITVADTGAGIAPDFLPRLFERFHQADSTTTRRFGGLGLGLSIARQLVDLHGGTITAVSPGPGQGSTFSVLLPLVRKQATAPRPALPHKPWSGTRLGGVRVLVVDDEPDARDLLRRVLERSEAHVRVADSADGAMAAILAERPDVLVSDIGMPTEDGYGLIRRVRALPDDTRRSLPAIALTAYTRPVDRDKALAAGFQQHLSKPINPADLLSAVARLTESHAADAP